jgi:hypothetical protein
MQVSRGGLALHLTEHYGDCCPGSTVFVRMRGIDGLHRELVAKNYDYLHPGLHGSNRSVRQPAAILRGFVAPAANRLTM